MSDIDAQPASTGAVDALALHDALERLVAFDPAKNASSNFDVSAASRSGRPPK
jgi:hypothetical protein